MLLEVNYVFSRGFAHENLSCNKCLDRKQMYQKKLGELCSTFSNIFMILIFKFFFYSVLNDKLVKEHIQPYTLAQQKGVPIP